MLQHAAIRRMSAKTRNRAPVSPLRYPGAKRWMAGYISRSITHNELCPDVLVEPFAGGASVSLAQLYFNLVERIALVDRDPLVAAFWRTVFFDTDWLVDQIWKTEVSVRKWEQLRRVTPTSIRDRAFKCFYLNRTSFSGVIALSAGPIGGKSQKSQYKIDCRFTKETLIKRIRRIAEFRDRVAFVWNLHWRNAISRIQHMQHVGSLPPSTLFYLDPPFYKKADSLYSYYFNERDHVALRDFLVGFDQRWILSYDFCPQVVSLYKDGGFRASNVNLIYTASQKGQRGLGKELIISNLPEMVSELQLGVGKNTADPVHFRDLRDDERKGDNDATAVTCRRAL